jgi:hypothetical protein
MLTSKKQRSIVNVPPREILDRTKILLMYALVPVRVQSRFKSGVKQDYVTTGRIFYSCNAGTVGAPKLRQRNLPPDGSRQAALVKMFLIQTETRLAGYGITEGSHYHS